MSNSTRSPSARLLKPEPWIAEWCTKQSLPPSSGVMKPKPLVSLNHFTFPVLRMLYLSFFGTQAEKDPITPGSFSQVSGLKLGSHLGSATGERVRRHPEKVKRALRCRG